MAAKHGLLPHLQPGEVTLLDYAADDSRDVVTLSDKEALVLQLYNQIQEQQLEKAVLEQGMSDSSPFISFLFSLISFSDKNWKHYLAKMPKNSSRSQNVSSWRRDPPTRSGGKQSTRSS